MKVVVTAQGVDLDSMSSPVFGRCPAFVFVDTETWQYEGIDNPCVGAVGGAGLQAAQLVLDRGVQAVLTHHVGPNAFALLQDAGVPVYTIDAGTVREAVDSFLAERLAYLTEPNVGLNRGAARGARALKGGREMAGLLARGGGRGAGGRRGGGVGGGRMGGQKAAGPGGHCVCPACGHREPHVAGQPCYERMCPKCNTRMIRE